MEIAPIGMGTGVIRKCIPFTRNTTRNFFYFMLLYHYLSVSTNPLWILLKFPESQHYGMLAGLSDGPLLRMLVTGSVG